MQVPSAEFIEAAQDEVIKLDSTFKMQQLQELHEAVGSRSPDFQNGYILGLQTARVIIETSPLIAEKGISPLEIL